MEILDIGSEGTLRNRISLTQCMELYPRDYRVIRKIAEDTLGEYYAPLKKFYSQIFQCADYQYIVFVARRSMGLAELFLIILWNETADLRQKAKLEGCWTRATTDSTLLSYSKRIAREIADGLHPRILIVDDVLIQGNGLNELLSAIEQSVLNALCGCSDPLSVQDQWREIVNSIDIRVFAQNKKLSVVNSQYQLKLEPQYIMEPKQWHDLSRKISNTIVASGMANAAFIMGAEVRACSERNYAKIQDMIAGGLRLDESNQINALASQEGTLFERHYFGWSPENHGQRKYDCSLRIIKNRYSDSFRIMPFVFLPQLTNRGYAALKNRVFEKWDLPRDNTILNPGQRTTRLEYEAMTLHLSESLLAAWLGAAGVELEQSDYDPLKVFLNYTINSDRPMVDADAFLRLTDPAYLFSWEELVLLLDNITEDAQPLGTFTEHSAEDLRIRLEDLVYSAKIQELTVSYRSYSNLPPQNESSEIQTLADNRRTNWNIPLSRFISLASAYVADIHPHDLFSCLLSFMDEGILTLKVRPEGDRLSQVLRMGEQSLFLWPQRYDVYLPTLSHIAEYTERSQGGLRENILAFLEHCQATERLDSGINVTNLTDALIRYMDSLSVSGQQLEDWDIDFDIPAVLDRKDLQWTKRISSFYLDAQLEAIIRVSRKRSLFNECLSFYPI